MTNAPLLEISGVTRDYKSGDALRGRRVFKVLRGIELDVAEGEILGLVGESGCGKSTLARLILGIEPPSSGSRSAEHTSELQSLMRISYAGLWLEKKKQDK